MAAKKPGKIFYVANRYGIIAEMDKETAEAALATGNHYQVKDTKVIGQYKAAKKAAIAAGKPWSQSPHDGTLLAKPMAAETLDEDAGE